MTTVCRRCSKEFEEPETYTTPMEELGQIFLKSVKEYDADQLCPECKEELGVINLLGLQ